MQQKRPKKKKRLLKIANNASIHKRKYKQREARAKTLMMAKIAKKRKGRRLGLRHCLFFKAGPGIWRWGDWVGETVDGDRGKHNANHVARLASTARPFAFVAVM